MLHLRIHAHYQDFRCYLQKSDLNKIESLSCQERLFVRVERTCEQYRKGDDNLTPEHSMLHCAITMHNRDLILLAALTDD